MSALALDGSPTPDCVLEARGVAKACGDRDVLADLDFAVARGEYVALFGASGAGKSLLLRLLLGLERPDSGEASVRVATGVVFEQNALFEDRSVEDNGALALRAGAKRPAAAARRAVHESLVLVGLKHVEHLRPRALPAGARRRVALARAIAHEPALLLVDEPAAGLDPIAGAAIHAVIAQLRTRLGLTVLVATRDPERALGFVDRGAFLHGGRIAAEGAPAALRSHADAALQQLLRARPHGPIP
jgi:phospholipid/cholesterol/gamma-HCH transport system ATP-binding protein